MPDLRPHDWTGEWVDEVQAMGIDFQRVAMGLALKWLHQMRSDLG
jgi:hypothetical protein